MIKQLDATIVFEKNWEAINNDGLRFIINEGGSRSSKTVSLCQALILWGMANNDKVISIIRKTFPALRATVMRDFFDILKNMGLYDEKSHNKSEHIYKLPNGTIIEFFSVDDAQKIRGRKRDIAWCNEANELWFEDFQQLNMRTEYKIIFDYNPSDSNSWLYDIMGSDSILIKSTFRDNPFLPESIKKQIEELKFTDEALYQIYALGEKAISKSNIFSTWQFIDKKPEHFTNYIYGLDFGYNHPTALVRIWYSQNELFIEEVIYESYLTTSDLISRLETLGIEKRVEIIADYARPEIIAEIENNGYNIHKADKSVKQGIDTLKSFKVSIPTSSKNIKKEFENYKWKKIGDMIIDEPIKLFDDAIDAARYGCMYIKANFINYVGYQTF